MRGQIQEIGELLTGNTEDIRELKAPLMAAFIGFLEALLARQQRLEVRAAGILLEIGFIISQQIGRAHV